MTLQTLPKAELHCHMDGILDRAMTWEIRQDDPGFPIDPGELERAYPIQGQDSFFGWWRFIDPIVGRLAYFCPILGRHIERLKAQNVRYSEVMIATSELPREPAEAVEKLGAFRAWVNQQEGSEIQVEFLVAFGRHRPAEDLAELAETFLALHRAGLILGVALAGPEQGHPVKPFRRTLAQLCEAGLSIEIHAGEWCGPESVWDALAHGYPDRIGHGVSLFQDARLLDLVRERHIHIEMCPTSNLKTGSISCIKEHPIQKARELRLNFSINTDDPGPFECSMTSEYELLSSVFGFEEEDFRRVYANSLAARFQPQLRVETQCPKIMSTTS